MEKYLRQLHSSEPQDNKFIHQSTNQELFQNHDAEATIDQIINRVITVNEVKQAIRKLKKGKAAGEDSIINEILNIGEFCLAEPITKLLNLYLAQETILQTGQKTCLLQYTRVVPRMTLITMEEAPVFPSCVALSYTSEFWRSMKVFH